MCIISHPHVPTLMPKFSQNPQYRGSHQNRYVFDAKIVSKERPCFPLTVADNGLILNAGTVHGISTGSEFTVYAAADISLLSAYGQLAMEELGPLSAVMKPSSINLPETVGTTIAVKTKAGEREDVRFYCPNDEAYAIFYEAFISMTMNASSDKCCTGVIVATPEDAHFEVAMEAGRVIFFIKDRTFTQYGVTRLFHEVGPVVEEIVPVIQAAAHYIWCFNLTESNPIVTANVQVEIFQLQHVQLLAIVRPATFVPVGPNLYQDDMVDLVLKGEDVPYGIKLTNNGVVDLYSNVFYFDSTDLSIGNVLLNYQCYTIAVLNTLSLIRTLLPSSIGSGAAKSKWRDLDYWIRLVRRESFLLFPPGHTRS